MRKMMRNMMDILIEKGDPAYFLSDDKNQWYNLPFFLFHVELDVQFSINHITGIAEPERFIYLLSPGKR